MPRAIGEMNDSRLCEARHDDGQTPCAGLPFEAAEAGLRAGPRAGPPGQAGRRSCSASGTPCGTGCTPDPRIREPRRQRRRQSRRPRAGGAVASQEAGRDAPTPRPTWNDAAAQRAPWFHAQHQHAALAALAGGTASREQRDFLIEDIRRQVPDVAYLAQTAAGARTVLSLIIPGNRALGLKDFEAKQRDLEQTIDAIRAPADKARAAAWLRTSGLSRLYAENEGHGIVLRRNDTGAIVRPVQLQRGLDALMRWLPAQARRRRAGTAGPPSRLAAPR